MQLIVHKIRLHNSSDADAFEAWVIDTDYATCPDLPSVVAFTVQRAAAGSDFDYFEVVTITDMAAFEADMQTPQFQSLVARFSQLADVVEEITGDQLGDGYNRGP